MSSAELVEAAIAEVERGLYRRSPVDLRVARHESAHACVGLLISEPALQEILIRDNGSGFCDNVPRVDGVRAAPYAPNDPAVLERLAEVRDQYPAQLRAWCARHIVCTLAGREVDEQAGHCDWWCSREDFEQACRHATIAVGRKDRDTFLAQLRPYVRLVCHDAESLIQDLADWLRRERRLDGPAVTAWFEAQPSAVALRSYWTPKFASPELPR